LRGCFLHSHSSTYRRLGRYDGRSLPDSHIPLFFHGGIHTGLVFIGIFGGFYLPSGISYLTDLVSQENWGKAISIHELAPNLAFVTTPFLAEFLLKFLHWRGGLECWESERFYSHSFPALWSGKQEKRRIPPPSVDPGNPVESFLLDHGNFLFDLGGLQFRNLYDDALFLVSGLGMERPWANTLIGISRTFGLVAIFVTGLIVDRMGPKRAMTLFLVTTGAFTLLLGLFRHPTLIPILVFLQAASVACLFPTGFTLVSLIFPDRLRVWLYLWCSLWGF